MKKAKLITIAMLLTCVKGYSISNEDKCQALKRGACQTVQNHKNEILDCDKTKAFKITPLKNNREKPVKGWSAFLSVDPTKSNEDTIVKMIVKHQNQEIYLATIDSEALSLGYFDQIKFQDLM